MKIWRMSLMLAAIVFASSALRGDISRPTDQVAAQGDDTCEQLSGQVLAEALQTCEGVARGELCLGSDAVSVYAQDGEDLTLASSEVVKLDRVGEIVSSPADPGAEQWGLAVLKLPAGATESDAGVTAVVFGEATLTRPGQVVQERFTLPVYNRGDAVINLRNGAGITYAVIGQLAAGEQAIADGRNQQGDWVRVQFSGGIAWVFTPLIGWDGDLEALDVLPPNDVTPVFEAGEPFQAFSLTTGSSSTCAAAPSGLLLQRTGTEPASVRINQVTLTFADATLLVTAVADDALDVRLLAGSGSVAARGVTLDAEMGSRLRVDLGGEDGLTPVAAPLALGTYPFSSVAYAPLDLLPAPIACTAGLAAPNADAWLHVGPGPNRGVLGAVSANASYPVVAWAGDPEGTTWWELDTGARTAWATQSEVRTIGACAEIAQAEAPSVVAPQGPEASGSAGDSTGGVDLAPAANSVWQMQPGEDNMSGECSGAPAINFCDHLAAIAPAAGGISWKGMEPAPYMLTQVQPNVYAYSGPNVNGTGTVNMTLRFTSETTLAMTMSLVLNSEPNCQHVYYYSGFRNW